MVGSRYPEWLHGALNVLIGLFQRSRLVANVAKSKAMMCHPGEIWSVISEEAVGQQFTGRGETYIE